jgi:hypothetical protein
MYRILFLILLCAFLPVACGQNEVILPDGNKVKVEIASTPQETQKGLMFRESLEENSGMLFIFPKDDVRLFWMKNTLIDLDMIFITSDGEINAIAQQVPHSYLGAPEEVIPVAAGWGKYVLEVNSGFAQKHNLKTGDRLILKIK